MTPSDLTAHLHAEIPLTRAMNLRVDAWDGSTVNLSAPLAPNNLNHLDTAFGGAISTMGIMAGYCLIYLLCNGSDDPTLSSRLIIQQSATQFLRPIDSDMTATATCNKETIADFQETLRRKRKSRLELPSQVLCGKTVAATHTGIYVALLY